MYQISINKGTLSHCFNVHSKDKPDNEKDSYFQMNDYGIFIRYMDGKEAFHSFKDIDSLEVSVYYDEKQCALPLP